MSYGQVGRESGCSARTVGWAMANVQDDVPWQRVVGADGYLRIGRRSVALQEAQRRLLEREGVTFSENGCVRDVQLANIFSGDFSELFEEPGEASRLFGIFITSCITVTVV